MKKSFIRTLLVIMSLIVLSSALFACGEDSDRAKVEKKLKDNGFTIVTSTSGAGLLEGSIIATKDGIEGNVVIQIYKKQSDVPQASTSLTKPCNNYYITSTSEELVSLVYDILK